MNKRYKVEVNIENGKYTYLSITHNGLQWSSLSIKDPVVEIPLIIAALQRHLTSQCSGQETPVIDEKKLLRIAPKVFKECLFGR